MLVGVVGKANTGKSTFFKALTLAEVEIANYPFATIKPNEGIGYVKVECADKDFKVKCNPRTGFCIDGWRFVPVKVIDVAGLVPGAHEGKGMGNQFLDDLNQADVLIHVIDCSGSTNEKGEPIAVGSYDPANDVKFLEVELDMWYLRILKKGWDKFARGVMSEKQPIYKALAKQLSGLGADEDMVEGVIRKLNLNPEVPDAWTEEQLKALATSLRKLTKPMIIACNKMDIPAAKDNFEKLKKEFPDRMLVGCSAESELALREAVKHGLVKYIPGDGSFEILKPEELNDKQKKALEFIKINLLEKLGSTGVQQVMDSAVFELLKCIAAFPVANSRLQDKDGNVLPDCLLVPEGTTALEFAFKVHTDLGNNFIKAVDLKTKQVIGKDHSLKHRDVIEIVSSK